MAEPLLELKLVIPDAVFQKIMWWVNKSGHEVSGFGSLDHDIESGTFTVRDVILLKQEVGPGMTEIDPISLGKAMFEQRGEPNALKWHWHSHVDMGVFWSADDMALIRQLGNQGWIVASVFNKKREIKSAFLTVMEIGIMGAIKRRELFIDDIPTSIQRYIDQELCDQWDKEYLEHVNVRALPVHVPFNYLGKPGFVAKAKRDIKGLPLDGASKHGGEDHTAEGFRWSYISKRWVYNPLYDLSLNTEESIVTAITTMDKEEVQAADGWWRDRESHFAAHYKEACKILKPLFGEVHEAKKPYEYDSVREEFLDAGFHQ